MCPMHCCTCPQQRKILDSLQKPSSDGNLLHCIHDKAATITRLKRALSTHNNSEANPFITRRKDAITCITSREDGHVPNRRYCKTRSRHTELSSRPCARCTVVHVHSIGPSTTCSDPRQTATCCTEYTTKLQQSRVLNEHYPRTTTPKQTPSSHDAKMQLPPSPPAKMATFLTDVAARLERGTLS
jgi:hypothetical protein